MSFDATKRYLYVDEDLNTYQVEGSTLIFRGVWRVDLFYNFHDVTQVGEDLFIARHACQGSSPTAIVDNRWSTLIEVTEGGGGPGTTGPTGYTGYTGYGATGYTGYTGPEGPVGPTGPSGVVGPDSVQCSEIDWGFGADQVNAPQMPYQNGAYPSLGNVGAALDYLLYTPLSINSFTNNVGTVELGVTVTSVQLNWSMNRDPVSQSINQGIGSLPVAQRAYTHSTSFTSDRTYTLSATSTGPETPSANTSVVFRLKRYWGTSSNTSLTDGQIIALANWEYDTNVGMNEKVLNCSAEYMYFCYPDSWGAATFTVNGLENTAWTLVQRAFVNASGHSETYRIYRSNNLLTGTNYKVIIT